LTTDTEIVDKLREMVNTLFDEYTGPVTPSLSANDVEQWDSLGTVQLAVMIEQAFNIRFSTDEIAKLDNLGTIAEIIAKKRG
jgi:acyl carrier protein